MNIFKEYKIIHLCDETDKKIKTKTSSLELSTIYTTQQFDRNSRVYVHIHCFSL